MKETLNPRLVQADSFPTLAAEISSTALLLFFLVLTPMVAAQKKVVAPKTSVTKPKTNQTKTTRKKAPQTKSTQTRPADELARLREEFIKATKDYKASLEKLRETYDKDVRRAEDELTKSRELFAAGLISRKTLEAGEAQVAQAKDKVAEVERRMGDRKSTRLNSS